jgi:hypothetical protein
MTNSFTKIRQPLFAIVALCAIVWGCAPSVDPGQYKTYDQLLTDKPAEPDTTRPNEEPAAEEPVAPLSATEPENAPTHASVRPEPISEPVVAAPVITAPSMKVVNGKIVVQKLPGGVRLLVPDTDIRTEADGVLRITYDDLDLLRILNMDPVTPDAVDYFPDWLKNLDGKKVRIRGFMGPTFEAADLTQFVIARDLGECCFGPGARIYNLVMVEMRPGKTANYVALRPIDVVGTFHINLDVEQDTILGLYAISDAQVIER